MGDALNEPARRGLKMKTIPGGAKIGASESPCLSPITLYGTIYDVVPLQIHSKLLNEPHQRKYLTQASKTLPFLVNCLPYMTPIRCLQKRRHIWLTGRTTPDTTASCDLIYSSVDLVG